MVARPGSVGIERETSPESSELEALVRRALWLRVLLAVGLHFAVSEGALAPDQAVFHQGATELAAWWGGSNYYPAWIQAGGYPTAYFYLVGIPYFVLWPWSLIPKLLNAGAGAWSVRLVYRIALKLVGDHTSALRAATLLAYLPSAVLWSVLNVRDIWVIVAILYACSVGLELQERMSTGGMARLALSIAGLSMLRSYLVVVVVAPLAFSFVVSRRGNLLRNAALGLVAALILVYFNAARPGRVEMDLSALAEVRAGTARGGQSSFAADVDISTPGRALAFLPQGIVFFLFAPFPWQISGSLQVLTVPEMLWLYTLVPAMVAGLLRLASTRLSDSLGVLLISSALVFANALVQANTGTAYRHRAQVMPFLMIFAAAGRRSPARVPNPVPVGRQAAAARSAPLPGARTR